MDRGVLRRALSHVRMRVVAQVVAALGLAAGLFGLIAHFITPGRSVVLGFAAFSPYLMAGSLLALLVYVLLKQRELGVVALVVVLVAISTQWRLFVAADRYRDGVSVVVMTSNLRLGHADAGSVVSAVRRHHVDVLMLEELTPAEQDLLNQAGLDRLLPHHVSDPRGGAAGTGLWSRFTLTATTTRKDFVFAFVTARADVPGVVDQPVLAAAHMPGPWPASGQWHHDIARLPGVLRTIDPGRSMIFGADLNATPDVTQFRRVLHAGVDDAAQQAGAGITRTFPSDAWYPPLIAIDHVLTRKAIARRVETVEIRGSDHRALLVTVQLPRAPKSA